MREEKILFRLLYRSTAFAGGLLRRAGGFGFSGLGAIGPAFLFAAAVGPAARPAGTARSAFLFRRRGLGMAAAVYPLAPRMAVVGAIRGRLRLIARAVLVIVGNFGRSALDDRLWAAAVIGIVLAMLARAPP